MPRAKHPPLRFLSPLHRATRAIGRHLEQRTAALGLSNLESHLVAYLLSYEPCASADLLRVFGHKPSTLSSMLDRLEGAGFVSRAPNPEDRRSVLVRLTRKGKGRAARVRAVVEELEGEIGGAVDGGAVAGFHAVVAAIERSCAGDNEEGNR